MSKKIWILTKEVNAYDQYGAYFEAAFEEKPDVKTLAKFFYKESKGSTEYHDPMGALNFLLHIVDGGGRIGTEDEWYNLVQEDLL